MQFFARGLLAAGFLLFDGARAAKLTDQVLKDSPVDQVVTLLGELKTKLEEDEAKEQTAYDEYACWCEDTLATKAKEITAAKKSIEELGALIVKLKAELASHAVDIAQLKKDIAATEKSIKESTQVRENEHNEYADGRSQSEQCIGALEAAVGVLTNAGTGKSAFLKTSQQVDLMTAAAGVRSVLSRASKLGNVNQADLQAVKSFVARPEDFVNGAKALSMVATKGVPGDYAPQSGQVQGVLKGLYDSFTADLEKANAEEALKQKAFEELMVTKKKELETLQATLLAQETTEADKTKSLADSETELDDTTKQLEEDEIFFAESKASCKKTAQDWAERTRLRTEELHGINTAVGILSSPEAQATFANATTTMFLQIAEDKPKRAQRAYEKIKAMASKFKNMGMAKIAVMIRTKGHFDAVIEAIDKMIRLLKQESIEDIQHKERCQAEMTDNTQTMEDLDYTIEKTAKEIERMEKKVEELKGNVEKLGTEINSTTDELAELNKMRTKEAEEFMQAMKDDTSAVALLGQAIAALSRTYAARNAALSQVASKGHKQEPAPEIFKDGAANTRKEESGGIIALLESIKSDLEQEIKDAQSADNTALANYASDRKMMEKMIATATTSLLAFREELIFLEARTIDKKEFKDMKDKDLEAEKEREEALKKDCGWVETHFDKRRDARKAELNGLVEAKNFLQGMA